MYIFESESVEKKTYCREIEKTEDGIKHRKLWSYLILNWNLIILMRLMRVVSVYTQNKSKNGMEILPWSYNCRRSYGMCNERSTASKLSRNVGR